MADYYSDSAFPDVSQPNFLDVLYAIHNLNAKVNPDVVCFGYTTSMPYMEFSHDVSTYAETCDILSESFRHETSPSSNPNLRDLGLLRVLGNAPPEQFLPIVSSNPEMKGTSPSSTASGSLRRNSSDVGLKRTANQHLEHARRTLNGQLESFLTLPLPKNWRELLVKEQDINIARRVFCYWERRVAGPDGEIETNYSEYPRSAQARLKEKERARCERQKELVRKFRDMDVEDQAKVLKRWFTEVVAGWDIYYDELDEEGSDSDNDEIAIQKEVERQWARARSAKARKSKAASNSQGWSKSVPVCVRRVARYVKGWFRVGRTCRRAEPGATRNNRMRSGRKEDRKWMKWG